MRSYFAMSLLTFLFKFSFLGLIATSNCQVINSSSALHDALPDEGDSSLTSGSSSLILSIQPLENLNLSGAFNYSLQQDSELSNTSFSDNDNHQLQLRYRER